MRDFRDAKAMARTLREALAARNLKLTVGESLELTARLLGVSDWNTLSAAIEVAAQTPKAGATPPPEPAEAASAVAGFSRKLEVTLHQSIGLARTRGHGYATLEHLLLALLEDPDAERMMKGCAVDIPALSAGLTDFLDGDLPALAVERDGGPSPTAGFQRVIQRAVIHVRASGRPAVTGAEVFIALFSEQESRAALLLAEQGVTRLDAVNFLAHGITKRGGTAAA